MASTAASFDPHDRCERNPAADPVLTMIDCTIGMQPVRDQGQRGTCVAFAATAVHEHARGARRGGLLDGLSPEHLFWRAKQVDGNHEDGTSFSSARDALANPGQVDDALWPYVTPRDLSATYNPPSPVATAATRRATMSRIGPHLSGIADELADGRPLVAGLLLWDGFYDCGSETLPAPAGDVDPTALHAVCLTGLDEDAGTVMVRNSWGPGWGESGYAWVALAALRPVLLDAWAIADDLDDDSS